MKVLLVLSFVVTVLCWGRDGHRITAQIAADRLTSETQSVITHYIGQRTLASIAPDPDSYDHMAQGRWSGPLHYVNMIKGQAKFNWMEDCPDPPSCVVGAILNYTDIQTKEGDAGAFCESVLKLTIEPCALEFLTHFMGDIHQPLHVGYKSDRGGNEVKVEFFGKRTELHEVWDTLMIEKFCNGDWQSYVDILNKQIAAQPSNVTKWESVTDPVDMADGSYNWTRFDVYVFSDPLEDANASSEPKLSTWYYNHNLPIVSEQLIKGGLRLAVKLNTLFGAGSDIYNQLKTNGLIQ